MRQFKLCAASSSSTKEELRIELIEIIVHFQIFWASLNLILFFLVFDIKFDS